MERITELRNAGRLEESNELGARLLAKALRRQDHRAQAQVRYALAINAMAEGSSVGALRQALASAHAAQAARSKRLQGNAWTMVASLRSRFGDTVGARQAIDQARPLVRGMAAQRLVLTESQVCLQQGDLEAVAERLATLTRLPELEPRMYTGALHRHVDLALSQDRLDDARAHCETLLAHPLAKRGHSGLILADVLRAQDRPDDARILAEAALATTVYEQPSARITRLQCQLDKGQTPDGMVHELEQFLHQDSLLMLWYARMGLVRWAALTDHPERWDLEWSRLPVLAGVAPIHQARETARAARETEARALDARWAARAVRAWGRVVEAATAAGALWLVARAERHLTRLSGRGAPVPLGPFVVDQVVGRGQQGVVLRGQTLTGRDIAVKVDARPSPSSGSELRLAAGLSHTNVAPVIGFGHVPESLATLLGCPAEARWVASPLAEHGTLTSLCGSAPWDHCSQLLIEVLAGLAHLHARGMLHLDVKPANVLLAGAPPRARLTDFGIARMLDRCTGRMRVAGTPEFMAPEQFEAQGRALGPWTDLYAVGVMAWVLRTGTLPFAGTMHELAAAHRDRELPAIEPLGGVPPGFDRWLRGLTATLPRDRYQRAADAIRDLRQLGPASPITARSPHVPGELPSLPARAPVAREWRSAPSEPPVLGPADQVALLPLREPAFVGREAERALLWSALTTSARDGRASLITIEGPLGGGATRLADWLAERAHELGAADVWRSRCGSGAGSIVAMLRDALRGHGRGPDAAASLADQLEVEGMPPTLAEQVARVTSGTDTLSDRAQASLLRELLTHVGQKRAVVWVVDDLSETPELVPELASLIGEPHPLVMVTTLTRLPGAALAQEVEDLAQRPDVTRLALSPLADNELLLLIERLLPLDTRDAQHLVETSGGWPAPVVAGLRSLSAEGALLAGPRRVRARMPQAEGAARPSSDWDDAVRAMMAVLDPPHRLAAELVGVLGPEVREVVWEEACASTGVRDVALVRRTLLDSRLVMRHAGALRVVHPGVKRSLEAHAAAAGRSQLLHELALEIVTAPAARAHHLEACDRSDEAASAWLDATQTATRRGQLHHAERTLARAHGALEDCGPEHRGWVRWWLARSRLASDRDDPQQALASLERLRTLAEHRGWADAVAHAHLQLTILSRSLGLEDAEKHVAPRQDPG